MKLNLTSYEAGFLVQVLEDLEASSGSSTKGRKAAQTAKLLRKRIEDLVHKAPKGAAQTRWAASLVLALSEHEDTCTMCKKTFRRCAEDLDLHSDLSLGCG